MKGFLSYFVYMYYATGRFLCVSIRPGSFLIIFLLIFLIIISRRALAREGDYEMMPVCVRACMRALVSHADFSKTTTATDFLYINCPNEFSRP